MTGDTNLVWLVMTLEQYLKKHNPKISHRAFADLVGVTQATINRYVRNERFPSPEMISKIQLATKGAVKVADWYSTAKSKPKSRAKAGEAAA